jgi:hypothetical protein
MHIQLLKKSNTKKAKARNGGKIYVAMEKDRKLQDSESLTAHKGMGN